MCRSMSEPANGSTPSYMTSWPLVQESANLLGISVDRARSALVAHGRPEGPTDRLPFEIVKAAVEAEGLEPERLVRVPRP